MTNRTTQKKARNQRVGRGRRSWHGTDLVTQAQQILRGRSATPQHILDLAKALKDEERRFGYSRKLLGRGRREHIDDPRLRRKLRQQHALCTYKDPDLPADSRLETALEILQEDGVDLDTTQDQETLGLAGAIFKRKWQIDSQKENLDRSLTYYQRGSELGSQGDQGYTAINAAFVLDQLASLERVEAEEAGSNSRVADLRTEEAQEIRERLITELPKLIDEPDSDWLKKKWWFYATVAEAFFGLERYDKALEWLQRGKKAAIVPDWEHQSTATQLAALARLRHPFASVSAFQRSEVADTLATFLGQRPAAALTAFVGKVGLGLSGGGFRASLFHIGVLAKLAELDILRRVEVLSCVSGGSIVGAHWYLELRQLLSNNTDADIGPRDYIACVKNMQRGFLAGVQKNIRSRIAAEFTTNLKMIFLPGYSRTMRAGDLYERFLYSEVKDGNVSEAKWWCPWRRHWRWLTDLYIAPKGEGDNFRPKDDNWRREAKVPDLILNATALNTGHNWQFTASWMGEPAGSINTDVDGNVRLRRMYYWEAPHPYQKVRLGHAVGASACVPGMFEPMALPKLYPNMTVRLVDGGVHDNQGIVGLLEQDCDVVLISDASGQMDAQDDPSAGIIGVPLRSNSIMMGRIRSEQYDELAVHRRSDLLRGLMFIHLKQDLDVDPIDWIDCQDPHDASDDARPTARRGPLTRSGILKNMQRKLSAIRTDLDSFNEAEAFALMTSGYRMTEEAFEQRADLKALVDPAKCQPAEWAFLEIEPALQDVSKSERLAKLLDVAEQRVFKVWSLVTPLKVLGGVLGIGLVAVLAWLMWNYWDASLLRVRTVGIALVTLIVGWLVGKWVMRIVRFRDTAMIILTGIALAILGPIVVRLHLWVFDRLYLKLGTVERALRAAK